MIRCGLFISFSISFVAKPPSVIVTVIVDDPVNERAEDESGVGTCRKGDQNKGNRNGGMYLERIKKWEFRVMG